MTTVAAILVFAVLFAAFGLVRQERRCGGSCGACVGACERLSDHTGDES